MGLGFGGCWAGRVSARVRTQWEVVGTRAEHTLVSLYWGVLVIGWFTGRLLPGPKGRRRPSAFVPIVEVIDQRFFGCSEMFSHRLGLHSENFGCFPWC